MTQETFNHEAIDKKETITVKKLAYDMPITQIVNNLNLSVYTYVHNSLLLISFYPHLFRWLDDLAAHAWPNTFVFLWHTYCQPAIYTATKKMTEHFSEEEAYSGLISCWTRLVCSNPRLRLLVICANTAIDGQRTVYYPVNLWYDLPELFDGATLRDHLAKTNKSTLWQINYGNFRTLVAWPLSAFSWITNA